MKLTKSLAELDAAADEMLAKSKAAEDKQENEEVTPEEISESATPETEDAEKADTENEEGTGEDTENEEVKKSEEPEEVVAEEDKGEDIAKSSDAAEAGAEENSEAEESPENIEKSMKDDFEAEEPIKKGMEESEFLSAVVEVLAKSMGDMQYQHQTVAKEQTAAADVLAKSLQAVLGANRALQADNDRLTRRINKLEKSMEQGFDKIMDSLDAMSVEPARMRKSMASISVHDRDFGMSRDGVKAVGGFDSLSKSQVMTILNSELYAGNQNVTAQDIISYESGAPLRPDLQSLVASKVK